MQHFQSIGRLLGMQWGEKELEGEGPHGTSTIGNVVIGSKYVMVHFLEILKVETSGNPNTLFDS